LVSKYNLIIFVKEINIKKIYRKMNNTQKEILKRVTIKSVKTMNGRDGLIISCNLSSPRKWWRRYG